MWSNQCFCSLQSSFCKWNKEVKTNLLPYHPVKITQLAETTSGKYAYVEGKGWIDVKYHLIQIIVWIKFKKF